MPDDSQHADDEINPYEPSESAYDIDEPGEQTAAPGRIAASEPPETPTFERAMENFGVIVGRAVGPVGAFWGLLFVVRLVLDLVEPAGTSGADLPVWTVVMLMGVAQFTLLLGLVRAARSIAFGGADAIPDLASCLEVVLEGFWSNLLAGLALIFSFALVAFAGGFLYQSESLGLPAVLVLVGVTIVVAFIFSPIFYLVATSDRGLGWILFRPPDIVRRHLGFLLLGTAAAVGMAIGAGALLNAFPAQMRQLAAIPIKGSVRFVLFFGYVAFFATIEETRGF